MLAESTNDGLSRITSSGHSSVYLSNVCADSPVHLRLCSPGEQGIVISNYSNFLEDKPFEWNAVPLSVYLYGVENPGDRPLYGSPALRAALQAHYRQTWLRDLCPQGPCTDDQKANWRDTVAATFVRDIYMFVASTTAERDEVFIAKFNALPNVDRYNGFTRNCANFARLVVNTYFPGASQADYINDFGMTSPKAIAKSFTHYAVKHQLNFHVVRITQIPGSYRRSSDARKGTEVMFTSKKWFFPMLFRSNELMIFTASYLLTGRFNPERELRRRPTEEVTSQIIEAKAAKRNAGPQLAGELKSASNAERAQQFGTSEMWERYNEALREISPDAAELDARFGRTAKAFAVTMDANGEPIVGPSGALWMEYRDGSTTRRIGVSASNVNSDGSDSELAYQLLLVRIRSELYSASKNREVLPEFQADWRLLEEADRNLRSKSRVQQVPSVPQVPTEDTGPVQATFPVGGFQLH
ncbi:hypothetical protein [Candidatus Korobacter versatilis]|nr:hypothetical protein [Candidatus Koribacter versatilis]